MVLSVFHLFVGEKIGDKIVKGESITHKEAEEKFGVNLKVHRSTIPSYARKIANVLDKPIIIMERDTSQEHKTHPDIYVGEKRIIIRHGEHGPLKCYKILLPRSGTMSCNSLVWKD